MNNRHTGLLGVAALALGLAACDTPIEPNRETAAASGPSNIEFTFNVTQDDFSANTFSDWTIHNTPGAWSISGGYLHANNTATQSVMIRNGQSLADGYIEAETDEISDGGLVLRFQSSGNYYLLAMRDDSRFGYANLEIYRAQGGSFTQIAGPIDISIPRGVQHTIRFQAVGSQLQASVNGQVWLTATDNTYTTGGFGVRHDNTRGEANITSRFNLLRWNIAYTTDNFTTNSLSNYTIYNTPGAWSVSGGYLNANSTAVQSVVIANNTTIANGVVEAEADQIADGGLVLRFQSNGNYYLLAVRDDAEFGHANLDLYRAQGGAFTRIAGPVDMTLTRGVPYTIRFSASGNQLQARVNGELKLSATDNTYTSGGVGVRHDNTRQYGLNITSRYNFVRWARF